MASEATQHIKTDTIEKNRQLTINIAASFTALFVSMGINFFLSPYIVSTLGVAAYGFIQLSNNLISYFSILTIALNSMSGRFIAVSYFEKDIIAANKYFTSTFYSNVILVVILLPVLVIGILNISWIISVPADILVDVQLLLVFMATNLIIGLLATNLGVSYYITNRLYLFSIIQIFGNFLSAGILIVLFMLYPPYIAYVGFAALMVSLFTQSANIFWKKRLIPDLKLKRNDYDFKKVKELLSSGIWNSMTRLGELLSTGLDLLIANLLISASSMGVLAIAKIVPSLINTILGTMITTFLPNMTELFAKQKYEDLVKDIKQSMKIIGMFINIPIALLIAWGDVLFTFWFPTQDAVMLQQLAVITISPWAIIGQASIIHNVFTIVNRIKVNSILVTLTGFLNVIIVFVLLKTTNLGLYAVAGVSAILSIIRNLAYTVPFGAKYINSPWYTFYPEIGKSVISVATVSFIGYLINQIMNAYTWPNLILGVIITAGIGLIFNYKVVLNKKDRLYINSIINERILKRG